MARLRAKMDNLDDFNPPIFNFDPSVLIPGQAPRFNAQPSGSGSNKLAARAGSNLDVLSPQARAVNALQLARNKGKGRVPIPEIIELSDSDSEDEPEKPLRQPIKAVHTMNKAGQASTSSASGLQAVENGVTPSPVDDTAVPLVGLQGVSRVEPDAVRPATEEPPLADLPIVDPLDNLVSSVLEIVPDVETDHIIARYTLLSAENQEAVLNENPLIFLERILHDLFENPNYPKSMDKGKKRKRQDDEDGAGPSSPKKRKAETVVKLDLLSPDRQPIYSPGYEELTLYWLGVKFPYLRKNYIKSCYYINRLYAPTFVHLKTLTANGSISEASKKKSATRPLANGPPWENAEFERELEWSHDWQPNKLGEISFTVEDENAQQGEASTSVASTSREEEKVESVECEPGQGIECGCCFSEYFAETMIQCPDGHMFCKSCVYAFCQERLGSRNAKIKCMNQDGCPLEMGHAQLKICLPPKLLLLYERIKQDEEIAAAGLDNLEECPFCDYKCVIENEMERLFHCMNEDCGEVSCRNCKKKDHLPKTCAEAQEDNTLNAQHAVEEAMTNALMRKCPKCQATFVKTDGCNKITCTKCGQLSCYICRKAIKGYDHFNEQPGGGFGRGRGAAASAGNKCPLWDAQPGIAGGGGLEQRHHDEVIKARDEALAAMRQANPEVDVDKVRVDAPAVARPAQLPPLPALGLPPMVLPNRGVHPPPPPMYGGQPFQGMPFYPAAPYMAPQIAVRAPIAVHPGMVPQMQMAPAPAPYPARNAAVACQCAACRQQRR